MSRYQAYPKYKASGVEWLGDVPEHWDVKKLKYFSKIRTGTTPATSNEDFFCDDGGTLWVKPDDLNGFNPIGASKKYLTDEGVQVSRLIEANSVLVCGIGTIGKFGIASIPVTTNQQINAVTFDCKKLLFGYGKYQIAISEKEMSKFANGNVVRILNTESQANIYYPYPPIKEQTTIANCLDSQTSKIDTLIAKQQRMIALLGEKRQAVISHAVTKGLNPDVPIKASGVAWLGDVPEHWEQFRIDWISTIVRGNSGFKKDELLDNGEYVALQYGKTYKVDEVNEAFMFFVNSEFYKPNQVVHRGDTVLISTSETVEDLGHSCFYNRDDLGLIGGEQILLKPNSELIFEKYLYFYSNIFCAELRKYATGLKVFRFNIDDLKKIFISVPSVEEQEAIVNYIDNKTAKIDSLISKAKSAITLLQERRSALIGAAVTGKIDVRELA